MTREGVGRHEYDGHLQDLTPAGVSAALARLGGPALADSHDEQHLLVFEESARVRFGQLEMHRRNPLVHLDNLDLACYDREYAPAAERDAARRNHLAKWPAAVDMAVESLDQVPAPVAKALLPAFAGLAKAIPDSDDHNNHNDHNDPNDPNDPNDAVVANARAAQARIVAYLEQLALTGSPETSIGAPALAALMTADEGVNADLAELAERAERERDRLQAMLEDGCQRWAGGRTSDEVVVELLADHPVANDVVAAARADTEETIAFCRERGWLRYLDGVCEVAVAPPSRRWATAMLAWAGPYEIDAPSRYDITPPEASWSEAEQAEWLTMFSATALPVVTAHEVAPGHFAHGRAIRHVSSEVRRSLHGNGFAEGWAHYGEELMLEEGFRAGDPRFQIGVALEALVRVTRLACAIGLHTGAMTVEDATARFCADAYMPDAAARAEANRGTFDPTYGIYTWGKWVINDAREKAREAWGSAFSLRRFHDLLLDMGSPPLGLVPGAIPANPAS